MTAFEWLQSTLPASAPATHAVPTSDAGGRLLATAALLVANAFFTAAEFALVAVRRTRVEHLVAKGVRGAKALQRTLAELDRFIAGTQVGITLASIGLGWVGEPILASLFEEALFFLPDRTRAVAGHAIGVAFAFLLLTTVTVVLGELVPKSVALRHPERLALWFVRPLRGVVVVLSPFVDLLNALARLVLRGLRVPPSKAPSITPDELRYVVEQAEQSGAMGEHEADVVRGALRFPNTLVRQVMVHRKDAETLDASLPRPELWAAAARCKHSRVPVFQGSRDRIAGVLHVKDLLKHTPETFELATLLRPPLWVTPDTPIPDLVAALRRKRSRIALVTDEFSGFFGLVTLEDAAEVVLGEVLDEHEAPRAPIPRDAQERFVAQGSTRLLDLQEALDHEFEERAVTVGGFLMRHLGRLPEAGEKIEIEGFTFEVESVSGTQVGRVFCSPRAKASVEDESAPSP